MNYWFVLWIRIRYIKARKASLWNQMISKNLLKPSRDNSLQEGHMAAILNKHLGEKFARIVENVVSSCVFWNQENPMKSVKMGYELEYCLKKTLEYLQKGYTQLYSLCVLWVYIDNSLFIFYMGWRHLPLERHSNSQ